MRGARAYLRSLDPRLPRAVWIMEAGGLANAFGNGVAFPFVIIYLHSVRDASLTAAGLVLAFHSLVSLASSPVVGTIIDRVGGRFTLAGSLVLLAVGWGLFPLVGETWHAFLFAGIAGLGNGGFWPSQSTLLAGLTPQPRRHAAYALQRVTRNLGIGLGGLVGGLIAVTSDPMTFTVLFLIDAATFLVFAFILGAVPEPELPPLETGAAPGRYRDVLRHAVFVRLVGLNVVFVTAGYAQLELFPVFAHEEAGVSERAIGLIFLVNTLAIVLAQLPLARLLEGRRRMTALAFMTVLWAIAWFLVMGGGLWLEAAGAAVAFGFALVVFGLGECFQGPTQGALVADLAPPRLRGRYMAVSTTSWDIGFIIGPAVGGVILQHEPYALWPLAAGLCLLAGIGALRLERLIPASLRLTPG